VQAEDVLFSSWTEKTFEPAFVVFWDHKLQWLVVAVRGSVELKSVLTDIAAETCEVAGGISHSGMVRGARWILNAAKPVLIAALKEYPEYRLVCTGHSLGADVAAILALLLREGEASDAAGHGRPALLAATAYAIAPSPLLDPELAERCAPFIMSIMRNVDYITRLSVFAVDRLILELTERSAPKLATNWLLEKFGHKRKQGLHSQTSSARSRVFGNAAQIADVLVPPGRVLHVNWLGVSKTQGLPRAYWPLPGFYHELFISPQMFHDHLPIRYVEDLLCILQAAVTWHAPQFHLATRARDPKAEHHVLNALRTFIAEQRASPDCVARLVWSVGNGDSVGTSGQERGQEQESAGTLAENIVALPAAEPPAVVEGKAAADGGTSGQESEQEQESARTPAEANVPAVLVAAPLAEEGAPPLATEVVAGLPEEAASLSVPV